MAEDSAEIFDDLYLGVRAGGAMRKQRRGEALTAEEQEALGRWQRLSTWRKALAIGGVAVRKVGPGLPLRGVVFCPRGQSPAVRPGPGTDGLATEAGGNRRSAVVREELVPASRAVVEEVDGLVVPRAVVSDDVVGRVRASDVLGREDDDAARGQRRPGGDVVRRDVAAERDRLRTQE